MLKIMIDCLHAQVDLSKEERKIVCNISEKVRREKGKRGSQPSSYGRKLHAITRVTFSVLQASAFLDSSRHQAFSEHPSLVAHKVFR